MRAGNTADLFIADAATDSRSRLAVPGKENMDEDLVWGSVFEQLGSPYLVQYR
jgi:hypothetical protein